MKAYLAGPDVFYPRAVDLGREKVKLCTNHGVTGLYPLDNEVMGEDLGYGIFLANLRLMDQADFCIANLTPFRGPSADVGTIAELGYMIGRGKPVFAYTNDPRNYTRRVIYGGYGGHASTMHDDRRLLDRMENQIEEFGLLDNLMIDGFIRYQGFDILLPVETVTDHRNDLSVFKRCLKSAVDHMNYRKSLEFRFENKCCEVGLDGSIPVYMYGEKS